MAEGAAGEAMLATLGIADFIIVTGTPRGPNDQSSVRRQGQYVLYEGATLNVSEDHGRVRSRSQGRRSAKPNLAACRPTHPRCRSSRSGRDGSARVCALHGPGKSRASRPTFTVQARVVDCLTTKKCTTLLDFVAR